MAKLTTKQRNALPKSDFVDKKNRAYPINDASHARAALSMAAQHAPAALKARVRAQVHKKFPDIDVEGK